MKTLSNSKKSIKRKNNYNRVLKYKKRMLLWDHPLEFVNNMYGSHPSQNVDKDYFKEIYAEDK